MWEGMSSEDKVIKKGLGLQYKFILITTFAIILQMGIIGYITVEREKGILYKEVERHGRLLGETLAIPIINDLIYERVGLIEEGGLLDNYVMEIFNKRDVDLVYIAILNEEGKVISHNNIKEYGKIYSDILTKRSFESDNIVIQRITYNRRPAIDFGVPLSIGKKRWGTLKFGISIEKMEIEIIAMVKKIVILTLFFIAIGFSIILLLSRRFISPITYLANIMEKTGGDYLNIRADVKGYDELAILGEKFNSMIERIRQANEELKKTHEKMVQSEKLASIGILASGVAHEINNPLGGIFNCLQMLKQSSSNPDLKEKYLNLIKEGLERIESTVNKLLWMSRKDEHKPVNLNLKYSINEIYSFIDYRIKKNMIKFLAEIEDNLVMLVDPHDFQQMMLNIFINSIQSMPKGGNLIVKGYKENSKIMLEIIDTGEGITGENIDKIFDPFFTTKPPGEGTGLGLWMTYEIIKNYNGEISVESEVGKGSRFILSFPLSG